MGETQRTPIKPKDKEINQADKPMKQVLEGEEQEEPGLEAEGIMGTVVRLKPANVLQMDAS